MRDATITDPEVGQRIRKVRTSNNMTLDELAGKLLMTPFQVLQIEEGHTQTNVLFLIHIASVMGVSLTDLVNISPTDRVGEEPSLGGLQVVERRKRGTTGRRVGQRG